VAVAIAKGRDLATLKAPAEAINLVSQWLGARASDKKIVTITLRQASYEKVRNSNVEAWTEFARSLDKAKYLPVIVPDTEAVFRSPDERLTGLDVFDAPAVNVLLRAALYELSYLNLMNGGGPTEIAKFNHGVRYLNFLEPHSNSMDTHAASMQGTLGISIGDQHSYLKTHQKLIWRQDTLDAITEEFDRFVEFDRGLISSDDYYPAPIEPALVIANHLAKFGKNAQAKELFEYLLTTEPDNQALKYQIGVQENLLGHHEQALKWLEPLDDASLPVAMLEENLGDCYMELSQIQNAVDAYTNAIHREGDEETLIRTTIKLGWLLIGQDQYEQAVSQAENVLSRLHNNPLLLRFLGESAAASNQAKRARGYYRREQQACEKQIMAEPENFELILRIGRLNYLQENFDGALDCFEKLLAAGLNRPDLSEYLGDTKHRLNQVDEAALH